MATPEQFTQLVAEGIKGVQVACPKCFELKALKHAKSRLYYAANRDKEGNVWWIGICSGCDQRFLVANHGDAVFPPPLLPVQPDIPNDVIGAYSEARRCYYIGCYEASVLMTRRALELATAKAYPHVFSLADRIAKLVEDGTLPSRRSYSEAEILAKIGNEGTHAHERLYKNHEDGAPLAVEALELLDEVLRDMYRKHPKLKNLNDKLEQSHAARRAKAAGTPKS